MYISVCGDGVLQISIVYCHAFGVSVTNTNGFCI
jgi:hypothetical protein